MATTLTVPIQIRQTVCQGTAWEGLRFRKVDADGLPLTITVTAPVASGPASTGGQVYDQCTVTPDDDDYQIVSLTAAQTAALPVRQVFIDVWSALAEADPEYTFRVVLDVTGQLDPA